MFCATAFPCVPLTYVWAFGFVGCILLHFPQFWCQIYNDACIELCRYYRCPSRKQAVEGHRRTRFWWECSEQMIAQERSSVAADSPSTAETAVLEQKDRKLSTLCIWIIWKLVVSRKCDQMGFASLRAILWKICRAVKTLTSGCLIFLLWERSFASFCVLVCQGCGSARIGMVRCCPSKRHFQCGKSR